MRLVVDTNVFVTALLTDKSLSSRLVELWRERRFELITAKAQLDELRRVSRYPKIRSRFAPAVAGRLINELRNLTVMVAKLPQVTASPDPYDNYLLAIAAAGRADFLVTGDKRDLLLLGRYEGCRIVTVRECLEMSRTEKRKPME